MISNQIKGLSEFRVQTSEDILRILAVGTNNRMTRSTDFNSTSSRSHALLQLTFEIETQTEMGQTIINRWNIHDYIYDNDDDLMMTFDDHDTNNFYHHLYIPTPSSICPLRSPS